LSVWEEKSEAIAYLELDLKAREASIQRLVLAWRVRR
jgi:hypothetical protein